jgi:ankyrin repeat protein
MPYSPLHRLPPARARRVASTLFASALVALVALLAHWTFAAVTDADPNTIFPDAKSAELARAVAAGDAARVKALVAAGANPNARGDREVTMLQWALLQQSPRGMQALLENGADASQPGVGGATVVHMAAMATDPAYLKILLEHGADPNVAHAKTGQPPLSAALMNPENTAFDLLLAHKADPNRADAIGNTPLHVAAQVHKPECVIRLLETGADATLKNQRGDTFQPYFNIQPAGGFSAAAAAKHEAVHAWLRAHGVPVETKNGG